MSGWGGGFGAVQTIQEGGDTAALSKSRTQDSLWEKQASNRHAKLIMPEAKLLLFLSLKACSTFSLSRFMVTLSFRLLKPNCLELSLNISSISVLHPPHPMHQYPLPVLPSEYIQNLNLFLSSPLPSPWSKTSLSLALDYCLTVSVGHLLQR